LREYEAQHRAAADRAAHTSQQEKPMPLRKLIAVAILAATPSLALAQESGTAAMDHGKMGSQALMESNNRMMKAMQDMQMTGEMDKDFATMMIDHHQGAVDMAKAQLEHGTDPAMRKMAEDIIASQEKEIALFQEWLAKQTQ
jgi:uncharacterized protein (DUF305 family)